MPHSQGPKESALAQRRQARERDQHGLLGGVRRAAAGAQQRGAVALDERREGGTVARTGGDDELGVHLLIVPGP